jgi:hypothetical protein
MRVAASEHQILFRIRRCRNFHDKRGIAEVAFVFRRGKALGEGSSRCARRAGMATDLGGMTFNPHK